MTDNADEILDEIIQEYRRGIGFSERTFSDLEAKAKYWLTIVIPAYVALIAYAVKELPSAPQFPIMFSVLGIFLGLFSVVIYNFASSLKSKPMSDGGIQPTETKLEAFYGLSNVDLKRQQADILIEQLGVNHTSIHEKSEACLLYTSPSPRDQRGSRMPSSA